MLGGWGATLLAIGDWLLAIGNEQFMLRVIQKFNFNFNFNFPPRVIQSAAKNLIYHFKGL